MKKIAESNLGIIVLSIIPAILGYIATFKEMPEIKIDLMTHLPFIISVSVFVIIAGTLFIRKWIVGKLSELHTKVKAAEDLIVRTNDIQNLLRDYEFHKNNEQFQYISDAIQSGIRKIKKAKITPSEQLLFNSINEYDSEILKKISSILNQEFINYNKEDSEN